MTAQVHEKLILDGKETSMAYCPPLPEDGPGIVRVPYDTMETSCWRGYVGTWEVKDNKLYLVSLDRSLRLLSDEPILAEWVTGVLRVPRGELLVYVHMGFGSLYEEELHIKVVQGRVVKARVIGNRHRWFRRLFGKRKLHEWSYPGFENSFDGDDL